MDNQNLGDTHLFIYLFIYLLQSLLSHADMISTPCDWIWQLSGLMIQI